MHYGERVKFDHNYPSYFPQSASNPQEAWCYPEAALGEFRCWFRRRTSVKESSPPTFSGRQRTNNFQHHLPNLPSRPIHPNPEHAGSARGSGRGCDLEAHRFAQEKENFGAAGATIIGVSPDSIARLDLFSAGPDYCAGTIFSITCAVKAK